MLHLFHDIEKLISRFVEVEALAFAAEERRGGAEVASHGAADGGDDGRGRVARTVGYPHSKHSHSEAGKNLGMDDGRVGIFAQITSHPADSFTADDMVGVDQLVELRNGRDVTADHDGRFRRQLAHAAAHLAHLAEVGDDAGDAYNVVLGGEQFAFEALQGGEVEQRAGRRDVLLNHHQAPGAMKHAQGEAALLARHLVVIELHRINGAAAEFVVARVRAEDRAQQHTSLRAFGMRKGNGCT